MSNVSGSEIVPTVSAVAHVFLVGVITTGTMNSAAEVNHLSVGFVG